MIYEFVKTSFFGRTVYHLSGHKYFNYKEDRPDYEIPEKYLPKFSEEGIGAKRESSSDVDEKTSEIVVDWDGEDDPENPYNWPLSQKVLFIALLCTLTGSVYMGSAIYTPGVSEIMEEFNVGNTVATLPLSLFVFGYAVGPMIFSPLSENAEFGRTNIYLATLFIFVILQIPVALVKNIAGLCILRFLTGFFASPILGTGGASVGDIVTLPYMPVGIAAWSISTVWGPSFGPLLGSAMVVAGGWRWTFWLLLIMTGTIFVVLIFFMPETYSKTVLYRKAERIRAITQNKLIVSEAELENRDKQWKQVAIETLWRPIEIVVTEPVVLFIDLYIGLVYAIMYLWFEAFPIVFYEAHKFSLVEMGLSYIATVSGVAIGASIYIPTIYRNFTKKMLKGETIEPEMFLGTAIIGAVIMPIGLLIFAWTSSPDIHWIAPLIGGTVFAIGAFIIFQTSFNYLSFSFWRFLASVFGGNNVIRSAIGGAFPLFGRVLFTNVGSEKFPVGWGATILAFITTAMISIPVSFYYYGPKLRARSKYSGTG